MLTTPTIDEDLVRAVFASAGGDSIHQIATEIGFYRSVVSDASQMLADLHRRGDSGNTEGMRVRLRMVDHLERALRTRVAKSRLARLAEVQEACARDNGDDFLAANAMAT